MIDSEFAAPVERPFRAPDGDQIMTENESGGHPFAGGGHLSAASALLAQISADAQSLAADIEQATTAIELRQVARSIDELIPLLHRSGIGIALITDLVCALSDRLMSRLWALLAPDEVVRDSCLFVMGSEGRREQTLKTDQDNGLLLRDGCAFDQLAELADSFNAELLEFGYPLCPGGIMINNPQWRRPQSEFRQAIRGWGHDADASGALQLAILMDARAIAGDTALLVDLKADLWSLVPDTDAFLARFTRPIAQFDHSGGGWWQWLIPRADGHHQVVDLKKSGSFQIVHGVRSLAFKHRVAGVSTRERLLQLVDHHDLPAGLAADLIDALGLLTQWRLDLQLGQRNSGRPADNQIKCGDLATVAHAELDSVLGIVKHFREYLRLHCPFEMI